MFEWRKKSLEEAEAGLMKGTAIRSSGNCLARGDGERVVFIKTIRIDGLLSFPPGA